MRTFQVIFRNGLTRNFEATGYCKGRRGVVFMMAHGETVRYAANELTKVEEILDHPVPSKRVIKTPRPRPVSSKERRSIAA